jgi:hypothetical protein
MPDLSCRCDNNPNCALLFGGICIQRLKAVLSLRLVDTEQSLGLRFAGSRHEEVQYERKSDHLRHAKFAGLRDDKDPRKVIREHPGKSWIDESFSPPTQ